jgi:CHASE3 domain sensor protein
MLIYIGLSGIISGTDRIQYANDQKAQYMNELNEPSNQMSPTAKKDHVGQYNDVMDHSISNAQTVIVVGSGLFLLGIILLLILFLLLRKGQRPLEQ